MSYLRYFYIVFILVFSFSEVIGQEEDSYTYEFALVEAARQKTIGNINEAIKLYKRCIEVQPDSDIAYYELGSIYAALNQEEIAEQFLSKAYNIDPDNYWYLLAYIQILNYKEKNKEIITLINEYLKGNNDLRMNYVLANAYTNIGKEKKALKILEKIEKENGIAEQILLKRVEILKESGKNDKAEQELLKLIKVIPESPEYHIIVAEFYEETGNMPMALEYFKEAYNLDSTNIYAISNLADYYTQNGPVDLGLFYLDRAFSLDQITIEKKLSTLLYYLGEDDMLVKYNPEFNQII
ncbi:MAG: tetratricopeptide repeat protein, partial [Bacteroidales bacterium]